MKAKIINYQPDYEVIFETEIDFIPRITHGIVFSYQGESDKEKIEGHEAKIKNIHYCFDKNDEFKYIEIEIDSF